MNAIVVDWRRVLERSDLVGGELITREWGITHRAPISRIWLSGNYVTIESPWTARRMHGEWRVVRGMLTYFTVLESPIKYVGKDLLPRFEATFGEKVTIVPRGYNLLDPSLVHGLDLSTLDLAQMH